MKTLSLALTMSVVLCHSLRADTVSIDFAPQANTTWAEFPGILNGNLFPTGNQNYAGVPFDINSVWSSDVRANGAPGLVQTTIPINAPAATTVYTLLNTEWGQPVQNGSYLQYVLSFSDGSTYTVELFGNQAVRDYNNYTWTNSISGAWSASGGMTDSTVEVFNDGVGQRLDEQIINIPDSFFGLTLSSLTIDDFGSHSNPADALLDNPSSDPIHPQRSFLAGLSVDEGVVSAPEPASFLLLGTALVALGIRIRRHS